MNQPGQGASLASPNAAVAPGRTNGHTRQRTERRKRTGGGEALHGVDVGGAHAVESGRVSNVGQGGNDVERGARALGGVARGGQPAEKAAAVAGLSNRRVPQRWRAFGLPLAFRASNLHAKQRAARELLVA